MSCDCVTALQPGQQSDSISKEKKKRKEKKRKAIFESMSIAREVEQMEISYVANRNVNWSKHSR